MDRNTPLLRKLNTQNPNFEKISDGAQKLLEKLVNTEERGWLDWILISLQFLDNTIVDRALIMWPIENKRDIITFQTMSRKDNNPGI